MEEFERTCCIRGYHVYKEIWEAAVGEEPVCAREPHNSHNCYAVAVKREGVLIGQIMFSAFETSRCDILCCYWKKKVLGRSASRRPQSSLYLTVQA